MEEIWDLYDEAGRPTGETWIRRKGMEQNIPGGRYHIVCEVMIRNAAGEFLLTLRDPRKDIHPGVWEAGAGGSALSGETPLQAAEREMLEETGLTAVKMELIGRTVRRDCIFFSYLADTDCERDAVRLQEGETAGYRWVDAEGLLEYTRSDSALKNRNARYGKLLDKIRKELNGGRVES